MEPKASFVDAVRAQPENLSLARETVLRDLDRAALAPWGPEDSAAVVAIIAAVLAPVATRKPEITGLYRMWVFGVAILVSAAGHFGGEMTHGEGYLTEAFFPANPESHEAVAAGEGDSSTGAKVVPVAGVKRVDFAREVLPHLEGLWDDKYDDRWWPERLKAKRPAAALATAS